MPDNHYLRVRPIRPVDGYDRAVAREDREMAGTHPRERAAASKPGMATTYGEFLERYWLLVICVGGLLYIGVRYFLKAVE